MTNHLIYTPNHDVVDKNNDVDKKTLQDINNALTIFLKL